MSKPPVGLPFYPLANPKNVEYNCEVCSKPAYLQCSLCRVTYYCGIKHQNLDWGGIHEQICNNLKSLRAPLPFIVSEDERRKKKEEMLTQNINLVNLTQVNGKKLLFQGKSEEAVAAALQCLKFTADTYGLASIELVTPYLILAESSINLGQFKQAETYLSQAQWTVMKTQHIRSYSIKSQLNRKLGLLYAAKGDYDNALEYLAKDIFYASCEYGTDHICTAGGYFQMGEVFYELHRKDQLKLENNDDKGSLEQPEECVQESKSLKSLTDNQLVSGLCCQEALKLFENLNIKSSYPIGLPKSKVMIADSLYARTVEIWSSHLLELIKQLNVPKSMDTVDFDVNKNTLDDAQLAEAENMLYSTERYIQKRKALDQVDKFITYPGKCDPLLQLDITLSMLNYILGDKLKAKEYLKRLWNANYIVESKHPLIKSNMYIMENVLECAHSDHCKSEEL